MLNNTRRPIFLFLLLTLNLSHPHTHTFDDWLENTLNAVFFSTVGLS